MILCIGTLADKTFCHTLARLKEKEIGFDVLDIGYLCYKGKIHLSFQEPLKSHYFDFQQNCFSNYSAIYSRLIDISTGTTDELFRKRAASMCQALSKYLRVIKTPVLNRPLLDQTNFSKLFHAVHITTLTGWRIPRSCLTNQAEEAVKFFESCGGHVIYKGCSSAKTWISKLKQDDLSRLHVIARCPVLFQEQIEGPDVRIHVVGNEIFPEMICSPHIDYRLTRKNQYSFIEPPTEITEGCIALSEKTGIPFLGIDFKIDKHGNWYFLEANNLPCYEGYDKRKKYAISDSIINWLLK
jgi:glutathione synthase/RimK-type ligase-like ATP-grasp enzyme